jgi:hypothetical protein
MEDLCADQVEEGLGVAQQGQCLVAAGVGHLAQDDARHRGPAPHVLDPGGDGGLGAVPQRFRARERLLEHLEKPPEHAAQDRLIELSLVPEVVDDGGSPDPHALGHVLEARGGEAPLREEGLRSLEDGRPRLLRAGSDAHLPGHGLH